MSRADLLALTPASVAALANLGLVKRAQKEIEAGKGPALEEESSGVVIGRFEDGVVTRIPPSVPLRDAPCSCGATTVCRHRVAVVLHYAAWHAENASPASLAGARLKAPPDEVWSPSCFDDEALGAHVGKRVFARAEVLARGGLVVELEGGTIPLAKLPTCAVRFHVPRDLAYARCDCQAAIACEHVVLAAWAFRQADRRKSAYPCTIELGASDGKRRGDDGVRVALEETRALVEHVVREGVAHLGDAEGPRFAKVRTALAKSGFVWPGALVDDVERMLEGYRGRSARYRTSELVFFLTSLEARLRAFANASELPPRFVLGSDEARETALDHVRLVSLGARVEADGDTREASVYLADPDSGIVLVAARTFTKPSGAGEPETGPALARRTMTGRISLDLLAHGQLVTRVAKRQANHALSLGASRVGQTSVAPSAGDWDSLPRGLLVRDLEELTIALRKRPPRVLRPRTLATEMRVFALEPGAVQDLGYRPADQELSCSIACGESGRLRLVRHHTRASPAALDVLARALASEPGPRFIAGDVTCGPEGLTIDPTAIVTDRVIVPDLEEAPRTVENLPRYELRGGSPIHRAVVTADALLEEAVHDGLLRVRSGFVERARHAAVGLGAIGLNGTRAPLERLGEAITANDLPSAIRAWLDAALRLELTREAMLG